MPDSSPTYEAESQGFHAAAGIAAVVIPGLGHWVRGERLRGVYIGCGVLGLFLGGALDRGIDTVDSKENPIWFYAQALVGPPAFAVDYVHQTQFKGRAGREVRTLSPDEARAKDGTVISAPADPKTGVKARPPKSKSLAKVNELGTLFGALAGMLNLIAIIDAAFPDAEEGMSVLAWRPFLDPIDAHSWWFVLLIPLALGVSLTYKAVRLPDLSRLWREVAILTTQIVIGIILLGLASFLVIQKILPIIAPK